MTGWPSPPVAGAALPLDADQAPDALGRGEPGKAALDEATPGQREVLPGEGPPLGLGELREAQAQIGMHHPPARRDDHVKQQADGAADGRLQRQGQPVEQPQQGDDDSTHGMSGRVGSWWAWRAGAAGAPDGRL
jgi:hypothetical protein